MTQEPSISAEQTKATPKANAKAAPKTSGWRNIASTIILFITVPLVAFVLATYVFQSFQVSGESMERTLQNGDRVLVWKIPRTIARITKHDYIPARGDVIVFNSPSLHKADGSEKQLIKRVVALPGERVVVKNGTITIYNQQHPGGFNPDSQPGFPTTIVTPTNGSVDLTVPAGQVFVCGDNRDNSIDSRSFGAIASHDIIGHMALRILPLNKFGSYL